MSNNHIWPTKKPTEKLTLGPLGAPPFITPAPYTGEATTVALYTEDFLWEAGSTLVDMGDLNSRTTILYPSAAVQGTVGFGTTGDLSGLEVGDRLVIYVVPNGTWPDNFMRPSGIGFDPSLFTIYYPDGTDASGTFISPNGETGMSYVYAFTWNGQGFVTESPTMT